MDNISRIAVLTSGGDAPGMNAAIRAVVFAAHKSNIDVIGIRHGYNGLITDDIVPLTKADVSGIIHLGGTILKSARCKEMFTEDGMQKAAATLTAEQVDALIVIGGDGSFSALLELQNYWSGLTIGIPGTIDNDIDETDFTIGFSTALNTGIEAIDKIRDTADAFERIFIVELMGKHSGFITFNVGVACAAEQVLSFENTHLNSNTEKVFKKIAQRIKKAQKNRHDSYIIVIAENLWKGGAYALAKQLVEEEGIDCTACTLGHIQRGGSPVAKDRILATKMGVYAVQAILKGDSNVMISEQNNLMCTVPLTVTVQHNKKVNQNLIDAQKNILAITDLSD